MSIRTTSIEKQNSGVLDAYTRMAEGLPYPAAGIGPENGILFMNSAFRGQLLPSPDAECPTTLRQSLIRIKDENRWVNVDLLTPEGHEGFRVFHRCVPDGISSFHLYSAERLPADPTREQDPAFDSALRSLHHDFKNSLQIIMSLIHLEAREGSDKNKAFEEIQNRIRAIFFAHDFPAPEGRKGHIGLQPYCEKIFRHLFSLYSENRIVDLRSDVDGIELETHKALSFGLLINEIMTNSLKYAFPHGTRGTISLSIKRDADVIRMEAGDDGVGLASPALFECPETLGLTLIRSLCAQLEGTIVLEPGVGTRYLATFPL